jgi:hypothetical protein
MVPALVTPSFQRWFTRYVRIEPGGLVLGLAEWFLHSRGVREPAHRLDVEVQLGETAASESPQARNSCTAARLARVRSASQ